MLLLQSVFLTSEFVVLSKVHLQLRHKNTKVDTIKGSSINKVWQYQLFLTPLSSLIVIVLRESSKILESFHVTSFMDDPFNSFLQIVQIQFSSKFSFYFNKRRFLFPLRRNLSSIIFSIVTIHSHFKVKEEEEKKAKIDSSF